LETCNTITRPYTSDKGPVTNGPTAKARRNTERANWETTSSVISRSLDTSGKAGAIMDDDTGVMKAKSETTAAAAHLRRVAQFFGLS
jgi:hypothetical protein